MHVLPVAERVGGNVKKKEWRRARKTDTPSFREKSDRRGKIAENCRIKSAPAVLFLHIHNGQPARVYRADRKGTGHKNLSAAFIVR